MMSSKSAVAIAGLVLTLLVVSQARAESYIFTVPSATVTDQGNVYCEGDADFATSKSNTSYFMGRCMAGAYKGLEIGLNGFDNTTKPNTFELQPNVKYQWYNKGDWQIASGITAFLPMTNTHNERDFAMLYTVGRYQTHIEPLVAYSPAISAGGWVLAGAAKSSGSRAGAILGLEQPLLLDKAGAPKLSFVTDWESGNQSHANFSSLTPGLVYNISSHFVVGAGYGISNLGHKYDTPEVWAGYTFKW